MTGASRARPGDRPCVPYVGTVPGPPARARVRETRRLPGRA